MPERNIFSLSGEGFVKKDLLGLKYLEKNEIDLILERAGYFKKVYREGRSFEPLLKGKVVANLFFEPSTRTRISFEKAAFNLEGRVINFDTGSSSIQKGETLLETVRTVASLGVDALVIRHSLAGTAHLVAGEVDIPVINAGDGCHEHPTQTLLDLFTLKEIKGTMAGLKVLLVGDILHSRVARSNLWGFVKMGLEVTVVGPFSLLPPGLEKMGVSIAKDLDEALKSTEVLYVLRLQQERQQKGYIPSLKEYRHFFGIREDRLKILPSGSVIMHPGPVVPGVELDSSVTRSGQSIIQEQVSNGVFVRMALFELLLDGGI
ncbi:MAG: aspartate carbamoyltransferase catalytic subunit [Candidatus Syntrophonatronum acetioxidans]|uniref:Aspartate carbamoyltransferase n=1 Tax=Candidatus Syntrophonatronum acetioxidans TaxID=1795816 RepID=A0A424Y9U8_9FIRM|nr:MAG: aspartate carbamoyltransferase catalytic subunit [Candidatus Syntrophonatronum acetioxidans]